MENKKKTGYRTLLISLTIATILSSVSVEEVHAVTDSITGQTDVEQVISEKPVTEERSAKTINEGNEELVEESIFASGNHGIDWRLTTDGVLYLGEGTMKEMEGQYGNNYPWTKTAGTIKKVIIEGNIILPEHPKLFMNMGNLHSVENIDYLDTSNVKDMSNMFYNTTELKEMDLSSWDTSNVVNMTSMFENTNASNIQLEDWDVSKVESMHGMFENATNIESLRLEQWDVSSVKDMSNMFHTIFSSNSNLTKLEISTWDVSNVTNMQNMFSEAKSLKSLNISNWDVSNVTNMQNMFAYAQSLESLDLSNWDVSNVENMGYMFVRTDELKTLDLSGWNVSKVVNMSYMFEGSSWYPSFEKLDLSNWILSGMTDIDSAFKARSVGDVRPVHELDLSNWNTDKLYNYDFISTLKVGGTLKLTNWEKTDDLIKALDTLLNNNNYLDIIGLDLDQKDSVVTAKIERHQGANREEVAVEVAKKHFNEANKVIIVNQDKFPDAISATNISQGKFPVLYTRSGQLGKATLDFIDSLTSLEEIYLLGGKTSISEAVETSLIDKFGRIITRVDGATRFDANTNAIREKYDKTDHIIIATGETYTDALYGVSYADRLDAPIILSKTNRLVEATVTLIRELGVSQATIIGGVNSVTRDIESQLKELEITINPRIAGKTRYDGSIQVASKSYAQPDTLLIASGDTFTDALISAPLAQKLNAPILLVRKDSMVDEVKAYLESHAGSVETIYIQGGPHTISKANAAEITKAVQPVNKQD